MVGQKLDLDLSGQRADLVQRQGEEEAEGSLKWCRASQRLLIPSRCCKRGGESPLRVSERSLALRTP